MMVKAILEFNLDEERERFEASYAGTAMHCGIWELIQEVRSVIKHGDGKLDEAATEDLYRKLQDIYALGEVE